MLFLCDICKCAVGKHRLRQHETQDGVSAVPTLTLRFSKNPEFRGIYSKIKLINTIKGSGEVMGRDLSFWKTSKKDKQKTVNLDAREYNQ